MAVVVLSGMSGKLVGRMSAEGYERLIEKFNEMRGRMIGRPCYPHTPKEIRAEMTALIKSANYAGDLGELELHEAHCLVDRVVAQIEAQLRPTCPHCGQ